MARRVSSHPFASLRNDVAVALAGAAQTAQTIEDSHFVSPNLPAFLSPSLAAMLTHAAHRLAPMRGRDS